MQISSNILLRPKTTMRIGGTAEYYAELETRGDAEEAVRFSVEKQRKLVPLGSGSNTIFADGTIQALVAKVLHDAVTVDGHRVTVGAGKNLPMLINELAEKGLDLSHLTGIPGTVGGAIFGNAGEGPTGIWIDNFIESVTACIEGAWKIFPKSECKFAYRESGFKSCPHAPIIWEATLHVPSGDPTTIKATIESFLKRRIETQPHVRTAGSCFKAVGTTPAWQLIDAAGLRGLKVGDVEISTKHANFLISGKNPTFADTVALIEKVKTAIPEGLEVEMRCVTEAGDVRF